MTTKKFYFLSLGIILAASIYPIIMGAELLAAYFQNGGINVNAYPKYIIPYTPICISLILITALLPLFMKLFKRFVLPAVSILGIGLFLASEMWLENVTVFGGVNVQSWQTYSCLMTPQALQTIGNSLSAQYSPAFKVHFYIISALIILSVTTVIYGFTKMIRDKDRNKMKPLTVQLIAVAIFIGLCIFACFTAFFRTGAIIVSPLSAALMSLFFVVFGVTAGVYAGTLLYGRKPGVSIAVPSVISVFTTVVMYIGELVLMGGTLFKFGTEFLFQPLIGPFAAADMVIILLSGAITYVILRAIEAKTTLKNK